MPAFIFFDYGNTLCSEKEFDGIAGYTAVLNAAERNPRNISPKELLAFSDEIYGRLMDDVHTRDYEIPHQCINRLLFDTLELQFSQSSLEIEDLYWSHAIEPIPRPNICHFLEYLAERNIRTGVISNMSFSGPAMKRRLDRALPQNTFEFIVSSGDYGFRKPDTALFKAALGRAGLDARYCMHCGDSYECDIRPASQLGMKTVWYTACAGKQHLPERDGLDCIQILDWIEMTQHFEKV